MYGYTDIQIYRYTDIQINRYTDKKVLDKIFVIPEYNVEKSN